MSQIEIEVNVDAEDVLQELVSAMGAKWVMSELDEEGLDGFKEAEEYVLNNICKLCVEVLRTYGGYGVLLKRRA